MLKYLSASWSASSNCGLSVWPILNAPVTVSDQREIRYHKACVLHARYSGFCFSL